MAFALRASPELEAVVRKLLAEFLRTDEPSRAEQLFLARELTALPIYGDLSGQCLLQRNGTIVFVHWNQVIDHGFEREPVTGHWAKCALARGANTYPELLPRVPVRPLTAPDCVACQGTGDQLRARGTPLRSGRNGGCYYCAGLGWYDTDDPPDRLD